MRNPCLLLTAIILSLALSASVSAQITINTSNFPSVGSTFITYSTDVVPINLGTTGGPQTWDFTSYEFGQDGYTEIANPTNTPFAGRFPNATHAVGLSAYPVAGYAYLQMAGNSLYELGYAGTAEGETLTVQFNPPALASTFPITYQSAWSTVIRFSREVMGRTVTYTDSTRNIVDAWGTVLTEAENYPVLRIQLHTYSTISAPPLPPSTTDSYSYRFVTQDGFCGADITNAEGTTGPDFTLATIDAVLEGSLAARPVRGPVATAFSAEQNYPNPFNALSSLPVKLASAGRVTVDIYDETGRMISNQTYDLPAGHHDLKLDGSLWSTGAYFARVSDGVARRTIRMMLIK